VWANNWSYIGLGGHKLRLGDFGLAINNNTGASIGYVYGDSGTTDKVGESSQKLHKALGGAGTVRLAAALRPSTMPPLRYFRCLEGGERRSDCRASRHVPSQPPRPPWSSARSPPVPSERQGP
jgi:hypothetical protein